MFPTSVQKATSKLLHGSISAVKGIVEFVVEATVFKTKMLIGFYGFARSASWIFFSTSAILFAPVIFEVERAQMEEMQKQQQRQACSTIKSI